MMGQRLGGRARRGRSGKAWPVNNWAAVGQGVTGQRLGGGHIMGFRAAGVVRIFDFLRIRTRFRTVQPENKGDTNDDGAENEKIPNPHPADSETNLIITNSYWLMYNDTKASYDMQSITVVALQKKYLRKDHHCD